MRNKELFEKTVNILVDAYRNDTLKHGDCKACAVGNIIAYNCGINNVFDMYEWREKAKATPGLGWVRVFCSAMYEQCIDESEYRDKAKFQIDSTGYTWQELAKIEFAFETADRGSNDDDWMLNGLLAVYDILCEIHEADMDEVMDGELVFVR